MGRKVKFNLGHIDAEDYRSLLCLVVDHLKSYIKVNHGNARTKLPHNHSFNSRVCNKFTIVAADYYYFFKCLITEEPVVNYFISAF